MHAGSKTTLRPAARKDHRAASLSELSTRPKCGGAESRLGVPHGAKADLEQLVRAEFAGRFPLDVIPAADGGRLFHALSARTGYTEAALSLTAKTCGFWPWKPDDIAAAMRVRRDGR